MLWRRWSSNPPKLPCREKDTKPVEGNSAYLRIFTLHVTWVCDTVVEGFTDPGGRRKGAVGEGLLSVQDVPEHLPTLSNDSTDHAALI